MNWRSRVTGVATGDQAMFVRRLVFESLGGFALMPLMEDIELSKRLRAINPPACVTVPVVTSGRRWEQHGVWRTIATMWGLRLAYWMGIAPEILARRYGYAPAPSVLAQAAIAILAKAPVAGRAKTRLSPLLGPAGAARAQRRFAQRTWCAASAASVGPVTVWCDPDSRHRFFEAVHRTWAVNLEDQCAGDLGTRMQQICAQHFSDQTRLPLLLIGTDCPVLAPAHLQAAAMALTTHDVVLIPAEDGGYVLIGLRRELPQVFEAIDWSTPQVLQQTRARLAAAGASWHEMPALWDVDEPADWERFQRLFSR
jgi:rSAM/selenodomain-associated transferase 1